MEMTRERMENIIRELVDELAEGAEEEYLEERMADIFTEEERSYLGV